MAEERKLAGANYIVNFFNEIQQLNHHYAQYCNLMLELKNTYGEKADKAKFQESDRQALKNMLQTLRYYSHKIMIQYQSIFKVLPNSDVEDIKKNKKDPLTDAYGKIKTDFVIGQKDIEKFVVSINSTLVEGIIKDLLVTSQDIYGQIYNAQAHE